MLQPDDGGGRIGEAGGANVTASVHYQFGFAGDEQANSAFGIADVERLETGVQHEHGSAKIGYEILTHAPKFYLNFCFRGVRSRSGPLSIDTT